LIEFRINSYVYPNGRTGIENFHSNFEGCEFVIGPTGSGKSTLLKTINGLIPNFLGGKLDGYVRVFGGRASPEKVFFIKQNPEEMITCTDVIDELIFPLVQRGFAVNEAKKEAEEVCEELKIGHLIHRKTFELSTGELQLVELAAALTSGAKLLVFDEPFANLSKKNAMRVIKIIRDFPHVVSEHRLEFSSYFDRTVNLGLEIEEIGIPEPQIGEEIYSGEVKLREGEIVAITGDNGAGKTMMLKRIAADMRKFKLSFSMVMQNPAYSLIEERVRDEVNSIMAAEFGMNALMDRHPQSLSYGQMKRAAIAAAFKSKILLLDEPTAGQDVNFRKRLIYLLRKHRKTALIATHDEQLVKLCDRRVEL
jgi:energy-coupling factor transport system ATP-binding protein